MDPHTHPTFSVLPVLTHVCSLPDPDETGDDHPGPGRTLGKGYDKVGLPIERLLNKFAEKLGKGPRVTAERIRRRRNEVIQTIPCPRYCSTCAVRRAYCPECAQAIIRSASKLRKLSRKIDADCKQLVGYLKSEVPSTQMQALRRVLEFSVCDWDIRALLKSHGAAAAVSNLSETYWNFRISDADADDLLLSNSRKALVSLRDAEINTLLVQFTIAIWSYADRDAINALLDRILHYLHDPDKAFLVIRFFRKKMFYSQQFQYFLARSIKLSPTYYEWDECEGFICHFLNYDTVRYDASLICDWVLRHVQNMPRVLDEWVMRKLTRNFARLEPSVFSSMHRSRIYILKEILSATGEDEQTLSLEALKSIYTHPSLSPLLSLFVCPLDRIVRNFVDHDNKFYEYVPSLSESRLYDELVQYIGSSEPALQTKAWEYINYFLALDIYRYKMMLKALSRTPFGTSERFQMFAGLKRKECIPNEDGYYYGVDSFYRHFDGDGNAHYNSWRSDCFCSEIKDKERIEYPREWTLYLRVERCVSFSTANHIPVAAGYDAGGVPTYLTQIYFEVFSCKTCSRSDPFLTYYAISDGMKPEDLLVEVQCAHRRELRIPDRFEVPVLRYAPDAYAMDLGIHENSLFRTGPFSWKPTVQRELDRNKVRVRVLTVQEATTAGLSLEVLGSEELTGEEIKLVEWTDKDCSSDGGSNPASHSSDDGKESEFYEGPIDSPQCITERSVCDGAMCRGSRLPDRPERMTLEMNEVDRDSEATEGEMMDGGMGHKFGEEINAGSDAHPNDLGSPLHKESIGRTTTTDAQLFTESTNGAGRTKYDTARETYESDDSKELAQTFQFLQEQNEVSGLNEIKSHMHLVELGPPFQDESSNRLVTTDLEVTADLDACVRSMKDETVLEADKPATDDNATAQIAQVPKLRHEVELVDLWRLNLIVPIVILNLFGVALGIVLGKYVI